MSQYANPGNGYEAWQQGGDMQPKLSILAVVSLVLSILCITAPLGLICGIAAIFTISASAGRKTGRGLAIAGVIIGLLFSSLLVAVTIGAYQVGQLASKEFFVPVGKFVQAVEDKDYAKVRTALAPTTAALVTDADIDAFRVAYQAKLGAFKGTPQSIMEIATVSQGAAPAMQALQNSIRGRQDVIPLPSAFANGAGVLALQINPNGSSGPGSPGSFMNLGVACPDGTVIWLKDPALLPAPPMNIRIGGRSTGPTGDPATPAPVTDKKADEPAPADGKPGG